MLYTTSFPQVSAVCNASLLWHKIEVSQVNLYPSSSKLGPNVITWLIDQSTVLHTVTRSIAHSILLKEPVVAIYCTFYKSDRTHQDRPFLFSIWQSLGAPALESRMYAIEFVLTNRSGKSFKTEYGPRSRTIHLEGRSLAKRQLWNTLKRQHVSQRVMKRQRGTYQQLAHACRSGHRKGV